MWQNNLLVIKSYFEQKAFVCYRVILDEFSYLVIQWIRPTHVDERKNPGWQPSDISEPVAMRVNTNDEQTPHVGIFFTSLI